MSVRLRFAGVVFLVLFSAACQDSPETFGPEIDFAPAADLVDGTTTGNQSFFFLPPLTGNPETSGTFDPTFELTVEICELSGSGCAPVAALTPEVEDDHYHANWKTSRDQAGGTFRISVSPLGSIDVDLYDRNRPRNSPNAVAKAGSNIPVKFIVEEGAFGQTCEGDCAQAAVSDEGGSLQITSDESGDEKVVAVLEFPDDWSPDDVTRGVTADCDPVPVGAPGTGPLHTDLDQWPLFCQLSLYPPLGPGETFDEPVFVAICNVDDDVQDSYHPSDRLGIRLGKQADGDVAGETFEILDPVDPSTVSAALDGCDGVVTQTAFTSRSGDERGGIKGLLAAGWRAVTQGGASLAQRTLAPRSLHAALMFRDGGAGALVSSFSLVGSVEPAVVSGTVSDSDGAGIAGVTVTLSGPVSASTSTDGGGAYAFGDLNAGFNGGSVYTVTVSGLPAGVSLPDPDQEVTVSGTGTFLADFQEGVFYNSDNGNYYEAVLPALSWTDADAAAQSLSFQGCTGHLATVTSQAENDFITDNMPQVYGGDSNPNGRSGGYWIGGVQPAGSSEPSGGWSWVTGEAFSFTNWATGEPNNLGNAEHHMHFFGGWAGSTVEAKKWNDEPGGALYGYVVEYECGS